jgi:hypothetical protein
MGSNPRLLACEASSVTLRSFVNVSYHLVIIRFARTAIFCSVNHHAHERRNSVQNQERQGSFIHGR